MIPSEFSSFNSGLDSSRKKLLSSLNGSSDITFIYAGGNIGDTLIWEGAYNLLNGLTFKKVFSKDLSNMEGDTAVITGCGGWCSAFHTVPSLLKKTEQRFQKVIVFPSSFDTSVEEVRQTLSETKALVFARELKSYELIKDLCNADYAYDTAFFYDFLPFKKTGHGSLYAYRLDAEQNNFAIPHENNDISITCKSLQEWLQTIASYETIYTDRAHVTVASAMLGKKVFYRSSNYHKVPGIVDFSLTEFPVIYKEHWG
jgi:exopolysaccharide biosynthesis predicted pyruvyltransferase EpsI